MWRGGVCGNRGFDGHLAASSSLHMCDGAHVQSVVALPPRSILSSPLHLPPLPHQVSRSSFASRASRRSPPISLPTTLFRPKRAERWSEESPGEASKKVWEWVFERGRSGEDASQGGRCGEGAAAAAILASFLSREPHAFARAMTRHCSSKDTFGLGNERLIMWDVIRDVLEVGGHNTCIRVDPAGSVDHPSHGNPTLFFPSEAPSCDSFLLSTRSEKILS